MKTSHVLRTRFSKAAATLCIIAIISCQPVRSGELPENKPVTSSQTIMLALLLDTSNSMDGLIEQAKSQLWKIVNELAGAKCGDGSKPTIKIALYEYGNDRLNSAEGYIRQVSALTTDLDVISEKLFALTTNGGEEYCGQVINTSLNQLAWSASGADLKLIFIAGNEPFNQGTFPYRTACSKAKEKGVIVNTIFCGNFSEGMETSWKSGADVTGGTYMSIEQDRKTVYVPTPYDDRIEAINEKLNDTYVQYGTTGPAKKSLQLKQDDNAASYSKSNKVERAISKSSHAYENSSWDLVDAAKNDQKAVEKAKDEELPAEMKGMNVEQRKEYVRQKSDERSKLQKEIQELNTKRQEYIKTHTPKEQQDQTLDGSMIKAIKDQAKTKKLNWEK